MENYKTVCPKSGHGCPQKGLLTRGSNYVGLTGKILAFWIGGGL